MSLKIKVSYTEANEASLILGLLKPIMGLFKVKNCEGTGTDKHLYFIPKNGGKP